MVRSQASLRKALNLPCLVFFVVIVVVIVVFHFYCENVEEEMNVLDTKKLDLVTDDTWNGRREQKSVCVLEFLH